MTDHDDPLRHPCLLRVSSAPERGPSAPTSRITGTIGRAITQLDSFFSSCPSLTEVPDSIMEKDLAPVDDRTDLETWPDAPRQVPYGIGDDPRCGTGRGRGYPAARRRDGLAERGPRGRRRRGSRPGPAVRRCA